LAESVETLERIVNENAPPLSFAEINQKCDEMKQTRDKKRVAEAKASLQDMEKQYVSGRGNLKLWTTEILAKIDAIFVASFMFDGEPVDYLFMPDCVDYLNAYEGYRREVDEILADHREELPRYCREYFKYSTIWEMRGLKFPVPLGTQTVVDCLHKIASDRRKGFIEVRNLL
jgi:hypothetical protein